MDDLGDVVDRTREDSDDNTQATTTQNTTQTPPPSEPKKFSVPTDEGDSNTQNTDKHTPTVSHVNISKVKEKKVISLNDDFFFK